MKPAALATAAVAGAAGVVAAQAVYVTRRPLPTVFGMSASGHEGKDSDRLLRVACAGDSTLTGPGLEHADDIWIRQALRTVAQRVGAHVEVVSYAVGGSRLADVRRDQIDGLLAMRPDVAVIVAGTNDAIHHTSLAVVRREVRAIVERVAPAVPQVVIGGVGDLATIARVPWPLAGVLRLRGRRVDAAIRAATSGFANVHYVDVSRCDAAFAEGRHALFAADLFHPNRAGHALWADVAVPPLARAAEAFFAGERVGAAPR